MDTLVDALRGRGVAGVHLGVDPANHRAIGFYRHLGFEYVPGTGRYGLHL
jgi:ribosomal protein S18 acetylase RimI-like enzyme